MLSYLLVFLGGGLGSICRYGIAHLLATYKLAFPLATFLANVISCVVLGLLVGLNLKGEIHHHYRFLLMTGFCGGFSTFSTFSAETFLLFESGDLLAAFANIALSLIVCLFCIYIGIRMAG